MRKAVEQENKRRKEGLKKIKPSKKNNVLNKVKVNINLSKKQRIAVILSALLLIVIILANNYTSLGLVLNKNITTKDAIEVELQTSNNKIIPYGTEILVYNNGIIKSYNSTGRETGQIKIEDTVEADINTSGKYIQVINKDKGIVYVYKDKYEVARIKIDGEIYSANINDKGISVIEHTITGNKTVLGIYDKAGKLKYNVKLNNNIVGKYVLSKNSRYLAYVNVNVSGISVQTSINLIDLSNIKEDATNTNVLYTKDNSLAYEMYWTGNNIVARFEDSYMIYNVNSNKKEVSQISNGQIVCCGEYDKKHAYIQIDEAGEYVLNIKKIGAKKLKNIQINDAPKYFMYEDGNVFVCYNKKIEVYNNLGMKIKNYSSDTVITEPTIFNNGRSIAIPISNRLTIFSI